MQNYTGSVKKQIDSTQKQIRSVKKRIGSMQNQSVSVPKQIGRIQNPARSMPKQIGSEHNYAGSMLRKIGTMGPPETMEHPKRRSGAWNRPKLPAPSIARSTIWALKAYRL